MKPKKPHHTPLSIDDLKSLLDGFESAIGVLTMSRDLVDEVIAIIEEGGGITVRARDTLKTASGFEGNKQRLEELEIRFLGTLTKIEQVIERATIKGINLLKGDSLFIHFDTEGKSKLETRGINLTPKALEFRKPLFNSLERVQDSRIDVMNAIDIATTLRHVINSDLFMLQGREEFSKETMANLVDETKATDNTTLKDEAANLLALQIRQQLSENEAPLAGDAARDILSQF